MTSELSRAPRSRSPSTWSYVRFSRTMNTTWPISDGSPGRSGTAFGTGVGVAASVGADIKASLSFSLTAIVYAPSWLRVGTAMTSTAPRIANTYRPRCPASVPVPDPTPNSEPTAMSLPSALTSIVDGYHDVGIKPLMTGVAPGTPMSYTATAFTPPSVT